ncbi:M1 family metallopeptidase [Stenotrophomonas rhizophila]|uniref:M1 family metallopeptidase n=1 Tax=Stenotrophomonas rhizophila TaxID=216778 RepID=UPI001E2D56F6|nr:M1 family metallopeptidase [Stenotrophomonas rhizophila]MCC7635811.1 M1 family metallopeptidase [Stenotrophomonas rhizophila]MCC7665078.1 M1 family metallopeptidase [Stenotrophomonas rhizophila]
MIVRACALLLLPLLLACTVAQAAPSRGFDVLHYAVALVPDIAAKRVQGQQTLRFRAGQPLPTLTLDVGELEVTAVMQGNRVLAFEQGDQQLRIRLPTPLKRGAVAELRILYQGAPTFGLEFDPARDEVYTIFSTRQWMPSVDAPDERATLDLSVTLPPALLATGTGRALPTRTLADGRHEHRWRLDTPMPGYVYGFAAGRYQQATQQHGAVQLRFLSVDRTPAQLRSVFARTGDMLDFFAARAGLPYRGDYQQALVASTIGQEMAGVSLMSEAYGQDVLADPSQTALMAHEAAHQWWGNRVTCASWQHFWLNEGFANFMTAAYLQQAQGEAAYQSQVQRWRTRWEAVRAKGADHALVYANWDSPSGDDRTVVYQKGAYVLHLLRSELGEEVFWHGIGDYTRANDGRSVVTADFQRAMEKAAGRSLQPFFAQWVYAAAAAAR